MHWNDISAATAWTLHLASGHRLGAAVVGACNAGLEPVLLATRTASGARSVVVLGVDREGATRSYTEVELNDDESGRQAWEQVRIGDVLAGARATLARADAALDAFRRGEPLPPKGKSPSGAS